MSDEQPKISTFSELLEMAKTGKLPNDVSSVEPELVADWKMAKIMSALSLQDRPVRAQPIIDEVKNISNKTNELEKEVNKLQEFKKDATESILDLQNAVVSAVTSAEIVRKINVEGLTNIAVQTAKIPKPTQPAPPKSREPAVSVPTNEEIFVNWFLINRQVPGVKFRDYFCGNAEKLGFKKMGDLTTAEMEVYARDYYQYLNENAKSNTKCGAALKWFTEVAARR